jgi:hypothetical protein
VIAASETLDRASLSPAPTGYEFLKLAPGLNEGIFHALTLMVAPAGGLAQLDKAKVGSALFSHSPSSVSGRRTHRSLRSGCRVKGSGTNCEASRRVTAVAGLYLSRLVRIGLVPPAPATEVVPASMSV